MKAIQSAKKLLLQLTARKKLIIICGVVLCLSVIGTATHAYHRYQNTLTVASSKTSAPSQEKPKTTQAASPAPATTETSTSAPATSNPQPSSTPTPASTQQNGWKRPDRSMPPSPPAIATTPTSTFSVSRISTAYTSCMYGVLHYSIGGVDIFSNTPTTQSFTWRVELNDGTTFESGTDTMPSGSTYWIGFPSTPSYPSGIGTIEGASDGDRARVVITSPNYSAGGWSDPVPVGSEAACQNG